MAPVNLTSIRSVDDLVKKVRKDLEGKTLRAIAEDIHLQDDVSRVLSKAGVGYVIEKGYFGIERNSDKTPDIASLGVEIKTSALKRLKSGRLTVKEPLSLNIINYITEANSRSLKGSSLYKKNKNILFVWYIHDADLPRSQYIVKYVFLWTMNTAVLRELEPDYQLILEKIRAGQAHHIHQSDHEKLTLCPKHNGDFKDPADKRSKVKQPFSDRPAEVRAFRLKNRYMIEVIRNHLISSGGNVAEFVDARKRRKRRS